MYANECIEREVDARELFLKLLEQWRVILVVGFIFALVLPFCLGLKASNIYKENSNISQDEQDNKYQSIASTLTLYVKYKELESKIYENNGIENNNADEDSVASYVAVREAYNMASDSLSADELSVLNEVISIIKNNNMTSEYDSAIEVLKKVWHTRLTAEPPMVKDSFGVKNIFVGFLLGVVIYIFTSALMEILTSKIKYGNYVEGIMGVRHYGNIYRYPYHSHIARFVHHKAIYDKRNKSADALGIIDDLTTKLNYMKEQKITLISLGNLTTEVESVISIQLDALKTLNIETKYFNVITEILDIKDSDILDMDAAFIQVVSGKTTFKALANLKARLEEYDIRILGTEFIEV